jgi:hypothetical protein
MVQGKIDFVGYPGLQAIVGTLVDVIGWKQMRSVGPHTTSQIGVLLTPWYLKVPEREIRVVKIGLLRLFSAEVGIQHRTIPRRCDFSRGHREWCLFLPLPGFDAKMRTWCLRGGAEVPMGAGWRLRRRKAVLGVGTSLSSGIWGERLVDFGRLA